MRGLVRCSVMALAMFGLVTACGSDSKSSSADTAAAGADVTVAADAGGGTPVAVTAGDTSDTVQFLKVDPTSVPTGKVTFTFKNTGNRQHEMIVLKTDTPADQLKVGSDNKVVKTFDLAAGSYVLVCNLEKHYNQGMKSAFTVSP